MSADAAASLETPSGKGAADENFPVASRLISARYRPHVAAFYAFARAADDIADNPALGSAEKIARLDAFAAALAVPEKGSVPKAQTLARMLASSGVSTRHPLDLLDAFRQDAGKSRYGSWDDLIDYCTLSASPVGRFLLDLHGEDAALYRYSDPLCDALQVLNHLQDIASDYRELDRIYLPADLMAAADVSETDLAAAAASPGLRRVIDLCLDRCDALVDAAAPLCRRLRNRRLAMNAAVILRLARRLSRRLRRQDPLAGRVALSRTDFALAALGGIAAGVCRR